jgi:hypothetical protein
LPAKIIVTESKGGSRISLLGSSGKELLRSSVFAEPRAKGATLRALRGLLNDVVVEDHTLASKAKAETKAADAVTPRTRRSAATRPATKAPARATKSGSATKSAPATTRRRNAPKAVAAAQAGAVTAPVATASAATAPAATAPAAKTRTSRKSAAAKLA